MKLYEVKQLPGRRPLVTTQDSPPLAPLDTWYFTSQLDARKHFNSTRTHLQRGGFSAHLQLHAVTVKNMVTQADWVQLLETDAPGLKCTLTPQDFILDRKPIAGWSSPDQARGGA